MSHEHAAATTPTLPEPPSPPADLAALLDLEAAAPRARWGRRLAGGVLLGALAAAAAWVTLGPDAAVALRWVTAEVARGDLTVTVMATGTVQPTNEVEISSELSGTVRSVLVDFNDRVTVGQVLAVLDTDKLEAQVAVSRAALASRQARVREAMATVTEKASELARIRRLLRSGSQSAQDLDTVSAAHLRALAGQASAEAEVHVAEADLQLKETDLTKARIVSPIDGVVLVRNVDPGQTVAASLQAPDLFTLAEDLRQMELQVDVDEADVGVTQVGQPATFTVDAYPERRFPAELRQLRLAPETTGGVVTYKAILSLDNTELLLRPGMTATAEVTVARVEGALLVPNAALRFEPPADGSADPRGFLDSLLPGRRFRHGTSSRPNGKRVWVLRDGAPAPLPVETGASDGDRTVITSGELEPGQAVIVDVDERR